MPPTRPDNAADAEYRLRLTPEQYRVTRCSATEAPFTGKYWDHHADGSYRCVCCRAVLFDSGTKFDSGTGWPSFTEPAWGQSIEEVKDDSHGMVRTEVRCAQCHAHLGHVFDDGPGLNGLRYCINSAALDFAPGQHAGGADEQG